MQSEIDQQISAFSSSGGGGSSVGPTCLERFKWEKAELDERRRDLRQNEWGIKKMLREKCANFNEQMDKLQEVFSLKFRKILSDRECRLQLNNERGADGLGILYKFTADGPEMSFDSIDDYDKHIVSIAFVLTLMEFHRYEIYLFDGIDDVRSRLKTGQTILILTCFMRFRCFPRTIASKSSRRSVNSPASLRFCTQRTIRSR